MSAMPKTLGAALMLVVLLAGRQAAAEASPNPAARLFRASVHRPAPWIDAIWYSG